VIGYTYVLDEETARSFGKESLQKTTFEKPGKFREDNVQRTNSFLRK
jgi:hypothetical protein